MIKKELIKVKLKDIKEYVNNTKIHTPDQISHIRDSIIALEDLDPISIDENNVILSGHGRRLAYKQLNPVEDREIEVLKITGLEEGAKKAWRIAANKIPLETGFDFDKLGDEFNALEATDFFKDTGFSTKEITEIWERDDKYSSELIEQEKSSTIEHTCPECGHCWSQEFNKSSKRN
jgi:hypothetical protein